MKTKNVPDNSIQLDPENPTTLSFSQLYHWVIWQMSQQKGKARFGAVRAPIPDTSWYPAVIQPKEKSVQVYGYLDTLFESPEEAAEWVLHHTK